MSTNGDKSFLPARGLSDLPWFQPRGLSDLPRFQAYIVYNLCININTSNSVAFQWINVVECKAYIKIAHISCIPVRCIMSTV